MLISIMTMSENYPDIWNEFHTPEGVDRDVVINDIKIQCAELELLYSDPDILKYMIDVWTKKNYSVWAKLEETLNYKYNPIWNVEGSETMEITRHDQEGRDLQNVRKPDLTTTSKVAGYNDSTLQNRDQVTETGTDRENHTGEITNDGTETRVFTRGMNLGVMTTQQLIREQRELVQFTVCEFITNSFKNEFCLMVY